MRLTGSHGTCLLARWHPVNSDLSRWLVTKQWIALLVLTLTPGVWFSLPCPETSPSILPTLSHPFTGYITTLFKFPLTATCCLLLPFRTPTAYLAYTAVCIYLFHIDYTLPRVSAQRQCQCRCILSVPVTVPRAAALAVFVASRNSSAGFVAHQPPTVLPGVHLKL